MSSFLDTLEELDAQPIGAVATAGERDDPFTMMHEAMIQYLNGLKMLAEHAEEDAALKLLLHTPIAEQIHYIEQVKRSNELMTSLYITYAEALAADYTAERG